MLESKRRALIFLAISLLLAAIAGFMFLQKIKTLNAELGGMTKIYVAAADIPSRTLIKPEQVKAIDMPKKYINNSYVTDVKDLIDKVLVVPLSSDDVISKTMIKPVSNARDENNRLVALPESERVHFDQQVEALDRVDLIISQNFTGKPVTTTFMKDIPVAAVMKKEDKFSGIAIEVSAQDAPLIIHMQNYADSIRVLKANVGKSDVNLDAIEGEEGAKAEEKKEEAPKQEAPKEEKAKEEAPKQEAPNEEQKQEQPPVEKKEEGKS